LFATDQLPRTDTGPLTSALFLSTSAWELAEFAATPQSGFDTIALFVTVIAPAAPASNAGIDLPLVAVNLSTIQFKTPLEFEKNIAALLAETGLPARLLELELTESVLMDVSRQHNDVLLRLRSRGHRIAIDDFGSGYSSLDYLRRYPVDRIKIAQNFIADIGKVAGNDAIVRAALGLARELKIQVVVEGVETAAQLELLKSWGGQIVQGFYFAKPLSVDDVTQLLRIGTITPAGGDPVKVAALA
jgi:EAL domain-containing protein (putative c-di-GMP-specific phosphodiesterase class I)